MRLVCDWCGWPLDTKDRNITYSKVHGVRKHWCDQECKQDWREEQLKILEEKNGHILRF